MTRTGRRSAVAIVAAALLLTGCAAGGEPAGSDSPQAASASPTAPPREDVTMTETPAPVLPDPDGTLLSAAAAGDAATVSLAIRAGAALEARDGRGRTALLLASAADHVEAASVLVAAGADPDALDDQRDTPWLVTGVTGSVAMAEVLLAAEPDLTIVNRYGGISIIPAGERGHVEYLERVLQTDIDVDHVNDLGWTALLEAVILGDGGPRHQETVRVLLEGGADRSIADRGGVTALEHARASGYDEIVALLD